MNDTSDSKPILNGLVLCGGMSRRMGRDKAWISYHGTTQAEHTFQLLHRHCQNVFVSARKDQNLPASLNPFIIEDSHDNIGPMAGLLAAHEIFPQCAWLIIACDMPWVDHDLLETLISSRSEFASAFWADDIEPLLSIWEPKSFSLLSAAWANGEFSLQRQLRKMRASLIETAFPGKLKNINFVQTQKMKTAID